MKIKLLIVLGTISMLLSSCIQTPEPEVPKRVSFIFNADNVGNSIVVGSDSIQVNEIKFLADQFDLRLTDGVILQTGVDALVLAYRSGFAGQDQNILTANIGFEDIDRFQGVDLFVDQPEQGDNIQDVDFFGEENNFSFIIEGIYNDRVFSYNSGVSFTKSFNFEEIIELNNEKETLALRVMLDVREVLVNQTENTILDPQDPANKAAIDSLFRESIDVESFAVDVL